MRIGFVIPYFGDRGGPAVIVREVATHLVRRGHDVTVFTTEVGADSVRPALEGVALRTLRNLLPRLARRHNAYLPVGFTYVFNRELAALDVVHIVEYRHFLGVLAARAAAQAQVPVIMAPHGTLPIVLQRRRLKAGFDLLFGRRLLDTMDMFHVTTDEEQEAAVIRGIDPGRIHLIPNGVDLPSPVTDEARASAKQRLGLSERHFVALFMARLHPDKGLLDLLESFRVVHRDDPNATLLVAGADDGDLSRAVAFVRASGLSSGVRFLGHVASERKADAIAAADLFVSLSRYETLSVSVLEAMANARCVLVSTAAVVPGFVAAGAGVVVEVGDTSGAAAAISHLADSPTERARAGKAGRELVAFQYSWPHLIDRYVEMYLAVSGGSSG